MNASLFSNRNIKLQGGWEEESMTQCKRGLVLNGQTINSQIHYNDGKQGYMKQ